MIEKYHFGSITISGKTYNHDVEVRWSGAARGEPSPSGLEVLSWWRGESHVIDVEDIKRAIDQNPETIVIGTGEAGIAEVLEKTKEEILSQGIELIIEKTGKAVETFNDAKNRGQKVIGLFHLTC